ncbi:MAG: FecR family protein [Gammaproteobacteria bacterium]|jgi:hypothetical protein|nr:FecR family protein [Gammaproteobacteria bacterium]
MWKTLNRCTAIRSGPTLGYLLIVLVVNGAMAAEPAGVVEKIKGTAWAQQVRQDDRELEKDAPIYSGDAVRTARGSSIRIRLLDGTKFELGEKSKMSIDEFVFEQQEEEESLSAKIFRGTFRFVTGLVAKKRSRAMQISTTVATIGIRGTHVAGEVDETSATIVLLEPEGEKRPTAIEVSNEFGSVTINEPGYGSEIPDAYSPPSPPRRMQLRTINNIMRSMQTIQRVNVPRPRMH